MERNVEKNKVLIIKVTISDTDYDTKQPENVEYFNSLW